MADKDLLEVISEMLRKQDQHSELIAATNNGINETNTILKEFMGVSIKQWEEQQKFNGRIFNKLDGIEKQLEKIADLEDRVKRIENILFKFS